MSCGGICFDEDLRGTDSGGLAANFNELRLPAGLGLRGVFAALILFMVCSRRVELSLCMEGKER